MLGNRLAKQLKHLRGWAKAQDVTCFRLYERDIPEFPLIVDWYDGDVVAWVYHRTKDDSPEKEVAFHALAKQEIMDALNVPLERLFMKYRARIKDRTDQYERMDQRGIVRTVHEQGLKFEVNLSDYLDTGLFLDHRKTRSIVRHYAAGKRVLNLFAYTGSFTVYARAGGAVATTTVDMSRTYQDWTRRNLALNGFAESAEHRLETCDCLQFLDRGPAAGEAYDYIVLDPPTFSNSKRMHAESFAIDRDWPALLASALPWLAPEGYLYFSTNSRQLKLDPALLPPGCEAREITRRTVPEDFRNERIHRCWTVRRAPPDAPTSAASK
ncbi:MAG: class I SAM-dependent methyltransferase [Phycisphaerae bacterium]|nr:class I SAM-dependent methyltransferase [Phycisphaerae bacterium]